MSHEQDIYSYHDQTSSDEESSLCDEVATQPVYEADVFEAFFDGLALDDLRLSVAMLDLPLRSPYRSTRPEQRGLR